MNVNPMAAPLPEEDPAAQLAAAMAGGMGGAPMDPAMDPMAGGMPPMPMGPDPAMGGMGGALGGGMPQFPTIDPAAMGQVLEEVLAAQAADRGAFEQAQQSALQGNPLFAAIVGAAPLPGAGADGGAIGETTMMDPATESEAVGLPYA